MQIPKAVWLVLGLLVGSAAGWFGATLAHPRSASAAALTTPYQAVLLDSGQVYYGKLSNLDSDFPVLTNVFYVQSRTNSETKEVTNMLIRRGKEWHGPDRTLINSKHLVMVEPVSVESQVSHLIAQAEAQGAQGK